MTCIKRPAVAGLFYPGDEAELRRQVRQYLAEAANPSPEVPKALIAPHAGYIYSGPIAGNAYASLRQGASRISKVILLAPSHRMAFHGIAVSSADSFNTPLGDIPVDRVLLESAARLPQVQLLDAAFAQEHSIEVHLPFLQESLEEFEIVPLLVGDVEPVRVQEVIDLLWGGEETLIVISSDLSHYLEYDDARRIDRQTSDAIEQLNPGGITHHQACGRTPVCGLLLAAREHHLKAATLDLRNSGDTAGPRNQVVGYGAYVFTQ
jgi:AmmeMemoRadiSam system protein B